jgi:hypothetical protein
MIMVQSENAGLPRSSRAVMMNVRGALASLVLCLAAQGAFAQQKAEPKHDELDVTMQIIVDPDAKLPDEVVRRIPLPARKPPEQPASNAAKEGTKQDAAAKGQERAQEAQGLGREMSERAKERAQDAAEQREQAQRSKAEERRQHPDPPNRPPGPPSTPPGH